MYVQIQLDVVLQIDTMCLSQASTKSFLKITYGDPVILTQTLSNFADILTGSLASEKINEKQLYFFVSNRNCSIEISVFK